MPAAFRYVHFAADNWFHITLAGFVEKISRGEQVSMVGYGHRGHLLAGRFVQQLASLAGAIKQTEIRVNVEMNKFWFCHEIQF